VSEISKAKQQTPKIFYPMNAKNPRELSNGAGAARLRRRFLPAWALMAVAATVLGGCQLLPVATADATRFFVLTGPTASGLSVAHTGGRLQVGLKAVEMPAYLRATKSMVVRDGANEIRYQDYARWAEPLEAGVLRILKERLLASPEVRGVDAHPMRGDVTRDYDVAVRIIRCEGAAGSDDVARFSASYEIVAADGSGKVVASRTFTAPETAWNGKDFGALATLLSEGVTALGAQIAGDLPK
jgi:uncharacterized lipoprotein YmbA